MPNCVLFFFLFIIASHVGFSYSFYAKPNDSHPRNDWVFSSSLSPCLVFKQAHFLNYRPSILCTRLLKTNNFVSLFLVLLLAGDVETNPGPINFGFSNCQSLRNKGPALYDLVSSTSVDILGLTETHIRESDTPNFIKELTPNGYDLFQLPRSKQSGGGVGFLCRQELTISVVPSPCFSSFEHVIVSARWSNKCLNFVCLYRPPRLSFSDFLKDFLSLVSLTLSLSSPTIFCGDFNVHWDDVKSHSSKQLRSLLESCDLKQHVDFATHFHGHTLDLLITPTDFVGINSIINSGPFGDHFTVLCKLQALPSHVPNKESVSFRRYDKIAMPSFLTDLNHIDFVSTPASTVSELYDQYHSGLFKLINKYAPLKTKFLKKRVPSWITEEYRGAKRIRRQYERIWRKQKTPYNRSRLRKQSNLCNYILNKAKQKFYSELISANAGDSRKLWKGLNTVLHSKANTVLPDSNDSKSLANNFCMFFKDKITKIQNTFPPGVSSKLLPDIQPPLFCDFNTVTECELKKFIMSSPTKSCSIDPWPTYLLKDCIDVLLPSLTKLINLSLTTGLFPDVFKKAIVTPLIKKSNLCKNELKNYRPVSGLCFISKLLERVVAKQVKLHLDKNKLGNSFQSAYKNGHSTETALLCVKNDIDLALSEGKPVALVLLDLSAAFDTIDHNGLLNCLKNWFGFNYTVLNWFKSYLSDRHQSIKIGNTFSDPCKLNFGVPQGSVLGPLLFSMYTYPLSKIISSYEGIKFHFYADDTQVYIHLNSENNAAVFSNLNKCLLDIQNWMGSNKLKLNPDKTEFILFGSKTQRKQLSKGFPVDILGSMLSPTEKVRNLGVVFDADSSFSSHVAFVCKSCFVSLRDFRRIRRHLSKSDAVKVANALVGSRLDYCNSLFRGLKHFDLNRLQCVQNSLARIVCGTSRFSHITPVLRSLHWLPIKYRCIFKTLTIIFKYLDTDLPHYFAPYLLPYVSVANTRRAVRSKLYLHSPTYCPKLHKSKVHFNHSFALDGPRLWNDLPDIVRCAPSLMTFRNRLKTYLFNKAYPP